MMLPRIAVQFLAFAIFDIVATETTDIPSYLDVYRKNPLDGEKKFARSGSYSSDVERESVIFRDVAGKKKLFKDLAVPTFQSIKLLHDSNTTSKWTFRYPYNEDATCACTQESWGEYESEEQCIDSYANSDFEDCIVKADSSQNPTRRKLSSEIPSGSDSCVFAVATNLKYGNRQCRSKCLEYHDGDTEAYTFFERNCNMEYYHVTSGSPRAASSCFDNYIFGHSDDFVEVPSAMLPTAKHYAFYRSVGDVLLAADCQIICQEDPKCIRWFWRRTPRENFNYNDNAFADRRPAKVFTCFLGEFGSTVRSMKTPVHASADLDPFNFRWTTCNLHKTQGCVNKSIGALDSSRCKECAICKCQPRCIWKSYQHISGPKHCGNPLSLCEDPVKFPERYTTPSPRYLSTATKEVSTKERLSTTSIKVAITTEPKQTSAKRSSTASEPQHTSTNLKDKNTESTLYIPTQQPWPKPISTIPHSVITVKPAEEIYKTQPPSQKTNTKGWTVGFLTTVMGTFTTTAADAAAAEEEEESGAPVVGIVAGTLAAVGASGAIAAVVYKGWLGATLLTSSAPAGPYDFTPRFDAFDESLLRDHEQFQDVLQSDFI